MTRTIRGVLRTLSLIGLAFLSTSALRATISVTLTPSLASPQPVGTVITWTATVEDTAAGTHEYQFSVGPTGGPLAIVKDFTTVTTFPWTAGEGSSVGSNGVTFTLAEGSYQVSVVAQNITNNTVSAPAAQTYVVTTRLNNGLDSITPTANPLVALFTAQKCVTGNTIKVFFQPAPGQSQAAGQAMQSTNPIPCSEINGANFYIAGMYPSTTYQMHHATFSPSGTLLHAGSILTFTTGAIPSGVTFPPITVPIPAVPPSSVTAPILLHGYIVGKAGQSQELTTATDLSGNVLWYYNIPTGGLTRTEPGGRMFLYNAHSPNLYLNIFEEIDLAGNVTLQTNANRINEQLVKMTDPITGQPRRVITQFDHEVRRMSNGNIVLKASSELVVTNAAQCAKAAPSTNTCDVLGTTIIVLNPNLQVVWAWDSFDFLNLNRAATLGETCYYGQAGCPVFFHGTTVGTQIIAQDWLHGNSIQLTADGNFLLSIRHQDWVLKINYDNGAGNGNVLWVMGNQINKQYGPTGASWFTMNNPPLPPSGSACNATLPLLAEYKWFTHQHDANFQNFDLNGEEVFTVFDNGDLRISSCDTNGHSRGYVLNVNETNMTVTPLLVQDLGGYSLGLGTAEVIPGTSNYHFENGQLEQGGLSQSVEVTPAGIFTFEMDAANVETYRSYRMQDLYTTPAPI